MVLGAGALVQPIVAHLPHTFFPSTRLNVGFPPTFVCPLVLPGSPATAASLAKQWADANRAFTASLHSPRPLYMPASSLDPSLALGFICRSPSDLAQLCVLLRGVFDTHGVQLFDVSEGSGEGCSGRGGSFSGGSEEGVAVPGTSAGAGSGGASAAAGDEAGGGAHGGGPPDCDGSGSDDEFVLL